MGPTWMQLFSLFGHGLQNENVTLMPCEAVEDRDLIHVTGVGSVAALLPALHCLHCQTSCLAFHPVYYP